MSFTCWLCESDRDIEDVALCKCFRNSTETTRYYCINHCSEEKHKARDCAIESHKTCFDTHIPDIPKLRRDHEQISAWLDWCIQQITFSCENREEQKRLHQDDQRAEWFWVDPGGWTPGLGIGPKLHVSQRFDSIWRAANPVKEAQYPSFVSLMGSSGSGKSHLVRAMMMIGMMEDMRKLRTEQLHWLNEDALLECRARGPVTRSQVAELGLSATSLGVHLYHDSTIAQVQYATDDQRTDNVAILFADCEGFYADTSKPTAAISSLPQVSDHSRRARSNSFSSGVSDPPDHMNADDVRHKLKYREIPIRAPKLSRRGKEGAELFYARFLYAFSDVVLFVTDKIQTLASELKNFLVWIVKAEKHSIPPRSLRTLIVVVNNPSMHAEDYYDEQFLKDKMLENLGNQKIWESSDELTELQQLYDKAYIARADKITTNDKFFRLFFQEVRCCYIPARGKDSALRQYEQYRHLRDMIEQGSRQSQEKRFERWSRYEVTVVSQLLDKAFEHFATDDEPFDFHAAARKDNPTPVSLSGHIATLLRHTGVEEKQLYRFVTVAAVCLITYEYRTSIRARAPEDAFRTDLLKHCEKGVQTYRSEFLPCAHKWHDGTGCTSRGFEHDEEQGHRHKDGMMVQGSMDFSLFQWTSSDLINRIERCFVTMYEKLHGSGIKSDLESLNSFRRQVLGYEPRVIQQNFHSELQLSFKIPSAYFATVFSNKTCFACLQAAPDHFLYCGHGFCVDCIKDFGRSCLHARYVYELKQCILCRALHPPAARKIGDLRFRLDPRAAGARLLTLDGGGIRGIIELKLLEKVETRVNLGLPVHELFDLIMGVSTGGIVSLALGTNINESLSLNDMTTKFRTLAQKIFEKDRLWLLTNNLNYIKLKDFGNKIGIGLILVGLLNSRYSSSPRREALQDFFSSNHALFGATASSDVPIQRPTRVAVTASSSGQLCTFSNYSHNIAKSNSAMNEDYLRIDQGLMREEFPSMEPKIWEAAMATSAAPGYFVPWKVDNLDIRPALRRGFTDGAVQSNIPIEQALEEKDLIWPSLKLQKVVDLTVSVGTGHSRSQLSLPWWLKKGNMQEIIQVYHDNVINSENIWTKFVNGQGKFHYDPEVHYRLNIPFQTMVDLDDWRKMVELEDLVDQIYENEKMDLASNVDEIAFSLVAKLLFFEPEKCVAATHRKKEYIKGHIWSRLDCRRQQLATRSLLNRIKEFYHQEGSGPRIVVGFHPPGIAGHVQRQPWSSIKQQILNQIDQPLNLPFNFDFTSDLAIKQSIFVGLLDPFVAGRPEKVVKISGFPISYGELRGITLTQRGIQAYPL